MRRLYFEDGLNQGQIAILLGWSDAPVVCGWMKRWGMEARKTWDILRIILRGKKPSAQCLRAAKEAATGPRTIEQLKMRRGAFPRGEKHWNWKGGISEQREVDHVSLDYKIWRKSVFDRDDHVCQKCGVRGGDQEAHHIKSYSKFPSLRYEIDNGATLCLVCHRKEHENDAYNQTISMEHCSA